MFTKDRQCCWCKLVAPVSADVSFRADQLAVKKQSNEELLYYFFFLLPFFQWCHLQFCHLQWLLPPQPADHLQSRLLCGKAAPWKTRGVHWACCQQHYQAHWLAWGRAGPANGRGGPKAAWGKQHSLWIFSFSDVSEAQGWVWHDVWCPPLGWCWLSLSVTCSLQNFQCRPVVLSLSWMLNTIGL